MICPRCSTSTISGPSYIVDHRGRRRAAVVVCARCSSAFEAHGYFGSARERAFREFGPWLLAA
jgi:hypothetical protein